MVSRRKPLLLYCPPVYTFIIEFTHCLAQEYMTLWPYQLHGPWPHRLHMQAPVGILKWTAAWNKISYLDDCLAVPCRIRTKDCAFNGSRNFGHWFFHGFAEEMGFEMGSPPFFQIA